MIISVYNQQIRNRLFSSKMNKLQQGLPHVPEKSLTAPQLYTKAAFVLHCLVSWMGMFIVLNWVVENPPLSFC